MNAPLASALEIDPAFRADPRPKSAVSTMTGVVGLAGLFAWTAVARAYGMEGPLASLVALLACGVPMVLWSLFVDKVHRSPSTGIDWDAPPRPLRESADISLAKIVGLWGIWAVIGALLLHRPLVLERAISVLDAGARRRRAAVAGPLHPLCALARPAPGRAARRRLAFRPAADRPRRPRRQDRAPPFLPRLGGQGLLPRLHDLDRAGQLVGDGPRRIRLDRRQSGQPRQLADRGDVHDRRDLRHGRLRADDEAARRPYPHRQPLCGGLDGGSDLLSAVHHDGQWRPARLPYRRRPVDRLAGRLSAGARR